MLLNLSALVNDKAVFSQFAIEHEIVEDRNVGVGLLEGANYVAVGLITAGAMSGEGGLASGLVFWIAGLAALIVAGLLYDRITPYDLHDELEKGNVAVAAAFAGVLVGFGNVIRLAGEGDFVSWNQSLTEFGYYTVAGLALLPFRPAVRGQGPAARRTIGRRAGAGAAEPGRRRHRRGDLPRGVDADSD